MEKFHFVKVINVERNRAFEIGTDFESFSDKLPQYFKLIRIRSIRDNTSVIEVHTKVGEKEMIMLTKHIIQSPEKHETFILSGNIKGSRITEKYETLPNSTKVTIQIDLKFSGIFKLKSIFFKKKIKNSISNFIDEFTEMLEDNTLS